MRSETNNTPWAGALPRLIVGLAIAGAGVLFALENMDLLDAGAILRFWPLILILIGGIKFAWPSSGSGRVTGVVLMLIGALLLLDEIPGLRIDIDPEDLWPLILVLVGLRLVWGAFQRGASVGLERFFADGSTDAEVNAFALMSGNSLTVGSQEFRGGSASALMGGVAIDLRKAALADGTATLETFAMWGAVEIYVPEGWIVESHVFPLMGAFEDNTRPPGGGDAPRLIVRGMVVMGGIEVSHKTGEEPTPIDARW